MNTKTEMMHDTRSTRHYEPTRTELKIPSSQNNYNLSTIEERLFRIKTQEIVDEIIQIITFIKELGKFGFDNTEVLGQIHEILSRLRSGDKTLKYTKIVHILAKYLSGIREYSSSVNKKDVIFYKQLFESTLVAIMQELDSLEKVAH